MSKVRKTVTFERKVFTKIAKLQSKEIVKTNGTVTFSKVLNEILKEALFN